MRWLVAAAIAGAVLAVGCAGSPRMLSEEPQDVDWRRTATPQDRARLRGWREAWVAAKTMSEVAGEGATMTRDPQLFDPDRALPNPKLPQGGYRCRVTRLGGRDGKMPSLLVMAWANCRVGRDGTATTFAMDGDMRTSGYLFDDTDARGVFLGTLAVGDETRPMRYARDARRDMAGLVERIGSKRWRMTLPYPAFASTLDVIEIVPAG